MRGNCEGCCARLAGGQAGGSGASLILQSHTRRSGCSPLGLTGPLPQRGPCRGDVEGLRFDGSRPRLSGLRSGSTLHSCTLGQGYVRLLPAMNARCQAVNPIADIKTRWPQRGLGPQLPRPAASWMFGHQMTAARPAWPQKQTCRWLFLLSAAGPTACDVTH